MALELLRGLLVADACRVLKVAADERLYALYVLALALRAAALAPGVRPLGADPARRGVQQALIRLDRLPAWCGYCREQGADPSRPERYA